MYKLWPICFAANSPSKSTNQPTNANNIVPRGGFVSKKNVRLIYNPTKWLNCSSSNLQQQITKNTIININCSCKTTTVM